MIPPSPSSTASRATLRSEYSECWTTPGIEVIGTGSVSALPDEDRQHQVGRVQPRLGTSRRNAAVGRSRRGRVEGNPVI